MERATAGVEPREVIGMQHTVTEVMTTTVARVTPHTPLAQVTKLLRERGIGAVPVVDDRDHVLGMLSGVDLTIEPAPPYRAPAARHRLAPRTWGRAARGLTAADRMRSPVITVTGDVSLRTAARLLQVHGIHHLPVVDEGRLVGMVTRRDLLAAFLRDDEQLRRQLTHALEMTWHLTWDQVTVSVHNGTVRLDGRVDRHSLAREVEQLAAAADGVTAVESELAWDLDDTTAGAGAVQR
ncbi:MAG TPA: CBS domain-containing protein [Actinomycetota bacterium]|nr:CBS domain-containing protein [Actinomycetota bacterium]